MQDDGDRDELQEEGEDEQHHVMARAAPPIHSSLRTSTVAFDAKKAQLYRTNSGDSFERKVMEMETKIRGNQAREVDDEGFTNYTDLNLTLIKKKTTAPRKDTFSEDLLN